MKCLISVYLVGLLAFQAALISVNPARAQGRRGDDIRLPAEDLKGDDKARLLAFKQGSQAPTSQDAKLLEKAAKWYVNRVTWVEFQIKEPNVTEKRTMNDIFLEFNSGVVDQKGRNRKDEQDAFMSAYSKALKPCIKEIVANPEQKQIARINAARMLARLGECGQDEVADLLVETLESKGQIEAVRFWALRGLRGLFANGFKQDKRGETLPEMARCITAVQNFLTRPMPIPADSPQEEKDAYHYLRREAIRALGESRWPGVADSSGKVVGTPTALLLLKVLAKDGVQPEPSFSERLEAAIGLCQLQSRGLANYQPDYAAQFVGRLIVDFGVAYDAELGAMVKSRAWKQDSLRLEDALNTLKNDPLKDKYVADFQTNAEKVLRRVQQLNSKAQANDLRNWLDTHPPKSDRLFKDMSNSSVKPTDAAGN